MEKEKGPHFEVNSQVLERAVPRRVRTCFLLESDVLSGKTEIQEHRLPRAFLSFLCEGFSVQC